MPRTTPSAVTTAFPETGDLVAAPEATSSEFTSLPKVDVPPPGFRMGMGVDVSDPAQESAREESTTSENELQRWAWRPLFVPSSGGRTHPRYRFDVLQDWEGIVESVADTTFFARLRDITQGAEYAGEVAELPLDDVTEDDRELVKPGSVFYMTIGRLTRHSGRRNRIARLVFRRPPAWTASTLQQAEERASRLNEFFADASG